MEKIIKTVKKDLIKNRKTEAEKNSFNYDI